MDAIRTLLLARTHIVVLDRDVVASAATRPSRDADVDRFEDELAQLGFVMSLDLAITIRRLPNQAIQDLRRWITDTLVATLGAHRPQVPLFRPLRAAVPGDPPTAYLRRVLTWLATRADQPCPWCAQTRTVGALDPCGHLVCRTCWDAGTFVGCPICHRRITPGDPFVRPPATDAEPIAEHVTGHDGALRLLHLAFDLPGTARLRFERLLGRTTPLSPEDRGEIETVIDTLGPRAVGWLPRTIATRETMAIVIARLWMVSPDRRAVMQATAHHLHSATDVLRVAVVLMGGNPGLVEPIRLASLTRSLRRTVLEALDRLPPELLVEDVGRHAALWKRVGERLHPYEHAQRLPTAALAFAAVRGTRIAGATFGPTLRARIEPLARVKIEEDRVHVTSWAALVEHGLRTGELAAVAARLAERPGELLRRADHLVRVAQATQPEAITAVLHALHGAMPRVAPALLLTFASHVQQRDRPWPRRVFFPNNEVIRAWGMPDQRVTLHPETITALVTAARGELVARAGTRRHVPRAVIDRALGERLVPIGGVRWLGHHLEDQGTRRDVAALVATGARPSMWDLACIHAAARANIVYVRDREGRITQVRRRDGETVAARLARLLAGTDGDGPLAAIPPVDAPTWFAVVRDDLTIPGGSEGYVLESPATARDRVRHVTTAELLAQLAPRA